MRKQKWFWARVGAHLDLPPEGLPHGFGCTLAGTEELTVRGCRKILSYTQTEVCLLLDGCRLTITGQGLVFRSFGAGAVTLAGTVETMAFVRGRG